jgi:antitoxin CptB
MTGTSRSSHNLDLRRRRALVRAWRRGTREMDLILGRFADAHIGALSDRDLAEFEALLDVPDPDVFAWVTGTAPPPADYATPLLRALVTFHAAHHEES